MKEKTYETMADIRRALDDPTSIVTQFSITNKSKPKRKSKPTEEGFGISKSYINRMLKLAKRCEAGFIRVAFQESPKIDNWSFLVILHEPNYYKGWRGKLKHYLTKTGIIEP